MDTQSEVVSFLSDGANYGAPGTPVQRVTTHISVVFLVGDRAFKMKRAVRLSYVDFSTLELREKFCRAELALNRRTAPDLYVALRAVTRDAAGRLTLDGSGPTVEWLIEMRRFADAELFDRMAEAHRLTPALMRDLADIIAEFHKRAEIMPDQGGRDSLAATLAVNDDNLRRAAPPLDGERVDRLREASLAELGRIGPLLDERRRGGQVRRCHGDLHLRNICLFAGRPTPFDCIEFSDVFASIDVLYDLAFLLMDLVHRDLGDLANLVFNRYLDRSGGSEGLRTLPLFLSARAAVRAHVLGGLARDGAAGAMAQEAAAAQSYLDLAAALLEPAAPRLLAVGGLSGTGKSTVAQALASGFRPAPGGRLIRSDVLRKRLMGVAPETRLPAESYSRAATATVYEAMRREAAAALAAGYSAILDATFLRPDERQAAAATARDAGVPFTGLWLDAPPDQLAARVDRRRNDASDADRAVVARQHAVEIGAIDWRRIDASGDVGAVVAAARRAVG